MVFYYHIFSKISQKTGVIVSISYKEDRSNLNTEPCDQPEVFKLDLSLSLLAAPVFLSDHPEKQA